MKSVVQYKETHDKRSERIVELRQKIRDKSYLDGAVQRIAFVMSKQFVESTQPERKF